jgi:hypothetical protein
VYFSNTALNTLSSDVIFGSSIDHLDGVVNWSVFDDPPLTAHIPEIGYNGVCSYFNNKDTPVAYQNRSSERMAEFLVKSAVPLDFLECVVVENEGMAGKIRAMMDKAEKWLPVHVKPGCYF